MKKRLALLSGIAFILALGVTSCKKDYTCTCTVKDSSGNVLSTSSVTINDTKSKATTACNGMVVSTAGETETCAIQ